MYGSIPARIGKALVPGLPFLWLAVFFLLPFLIVLKISLSDPATAQPPYRPLLDLSRGFEGWREFFAGLDLENFRTLLGDDLYIGAAVSSVRIAAISTLLLLLVAFRSPTEWRGRRRAIARCWSP